MNKKNVKILIFLLVLVLAGIIAFGKFSAEDSQGRAKTTMFRRTPAALQMPTPGANVNQPDGSMSNSAAVTISNPTAALVALNAWNGPVSGPNIDLYDVVSDGPAKLSGGSCSASYYRPFGQWKLVVDNAPLVLNQGFPFAVEGATVSDLHQVIANNYKFKIGTTPGANDIHYKEFTATTDRFATPAPNVTLQAGTYYITLYGKYKFQNGRSFPGYTSGGVASYANLGYGSQATIGEFQTNQALSLTTPAVLGGNQNVAFPQSRFKVSFMQYNSGNTCNQ